MNYSNLQYHYRPKKGWINDPNGLVYFKGYYHVFYQHTPDHEVPGDPAHWGHARTKDFLEWEELPVALYPDTEYDEGGCWSGTACVKDDVLYLIYTGVTGPKNTQKTCVAYSEDGIKFEKYEKNPVMPCAPADGSRHFRDPAVCCAGDFYYCVIASSDAPEKIGRLLLYKSENLFDWTYEGILMEWDGCICTECPSLVHAEDGHFLLANSVCPLDNQHWFAINYGDFKDGKFNVLHSGDVDKGPDQYAGQVFKDHKGRNLLIAWIPGWDYKGFADKDIGCMSVPRELKLHDDGKITGYPIEEVRHLLKDSDECVKRTEDGFIIERSGREPVVYKGEIRDLKILRDSYIVEVFVNGGEEIYSALL